MSFETFKVCLDKIPPQVHIHFSGMAEPWLNPNCTQMILHAYECGFEISVYTTTTGMSLADIDAIKHIPFRIFEIHLPDNKNYTAIKVDEEYLKRLGRISESSISGLRYMSIGGVHEEIKKLLSAADIREDECINRAGNIGDIGKVNHCIYLTGKIVCKSCSRLLNHNVLLPNGDVILCCMDYGMRHILGNLISEDYNSLFNNDSYNKVIEGLSDDSADILCRHCSNAKQTGIVTRLLKKIRHLNSHL
jgi:hypothetical protein